MAVTKPVSLPGGHSNLANVPRSLRQAPGSSAPSQLPHQQIQKLFCLNNWWRMFSLLNMCFSWIETTQPVGNLCCGKGRSEWYFLIKKKKGISSIVCTLLGEELSAPGEFSGY